MDGPENASAIEVPAEFPKVKQAIDHNPERNVVFNAIDIFSNQEDIRQFLRQYVKFLDAGDIILRGVGTTVERVEGPNIAVWKEVLGEEEFLGK